ncbi:MAG: aldo/keto reductase [Candidatus Thorarchaeota archaeon]|nr:aldo/keto reductase [Candidatus Thorarchaeota archaeon]
MQYRTLGKTGIKVSALGIGCMRLPTTEDGKINRQEAIALIRKGIDKGINYLDTAWTYHKGESEVVLGLALKEGYRERVTLATKCPIGREDFTEPEHYEKYLDEQLERLNEEYVDFYLFHGVNKKLYEEKVLGLNLVEQALKAKEKGKIRHLAFSFHDTPEVLKQIIDSGHFDLMLVQYNIIDQVNHEMINYAGEKGLAVAIMGPVGGGRLAGKDMPEEMKEWLSPGRDNYADLALKFVLSNPNVSVALSGMGSEEMLDDNLTITSKEDYNQLSEKEKESIGSIAKKFKELCDLVCTQCKYCEPCPNEVNISFIFETLQRYQIYGLREQAIHNYSLIGEVPWAKGKDASACVECGECLEKCPQGIEIIEQLKKAHEVLS